MVSGLLSKASLADLPRKRHSELSRGLSGSDSAPDTIPVRIWAGGLCAGAAGERFEQGRDGFELEAAAVGGGEDAINGAVRYAGQLGKVGSRPTEISDA